MGGALDPIAWRRDSWAAPEGHHARGGYRLDHGWDTLAVRGFLGISVPEELLIALAKRFGETHGPHDLTLVFAAGQGSGAARGLNRPCARRAGPARDRCALGPRSCAGRAASNGRIEAHCLPQGVLTHLYPGTAAGRPGLITARRAPRVRGPADRRVSLNAVSPCSGATSAPLRVGHPSPSASAQVACHRRRTSQAPCR